MSFLYNRWWFSFQVEEQMELWYLKSYFLFRFKIGFTVFENKENKGK